jgi:hypothetical protein
VLVEEVPARRELEAVDLHSEPEEHLSLSTSLLRSSLSDILGCWRFTVKAL